MTAYGSQDTHKQEIFTEVGAGRGFWPKGEHSHYADAACNPLENFIHPCCERFWAGHLQQLPYGGESSEKVIEALTNRDCILEISEPDLTNSVNSTSTWASEVTGNEYSVDWKAVMNRDCILEVSESDLTSSKDNTSKWSSETTEKDYSADWKAVMNRDCILKVSEPDLTSTRASEVTGNEYSADWKAVTNRDCILEVSEPDLTSSTSTWASEATERGYPADMKASSASLLGDSRGVSEATSALSEIADFSGYIGIWDDIFSSAQTPASKSWSKVNASDSVLPGCSDRGLPRCSQTGAFSKHGATENNSSLRNSTNQASTAGGNSSTPASVVDNTEDNKQAGKIHAGSNRAHDDIECMQPHCGLDFEQTPQCNNNADDEEHASTSLSTSRSADLRHTDSLVDNVEALLNDLSLLIHLTVPEIAQDADGIIKKLIILNKAPSDPGASHKLLSQLKQLVRGGPEASDVIEELFELTHERAQLEKSLQVLTELNKFTKQAGDVEANQKIQRMKAKTSQASRFGSQAQHKLFVQMTEVTSKMKLPENACSANKIITEAYPEAGKKQTDDKQQTPNKEYTTTAGVPGPSSEKGSAIAKKKSSVKESDTTVASTVKETAKTVAEYAPSAERVKESAETVAKTVQDSAKTVYENAPSKETVRETAKTAASTVKDTAETVYENAPSKETVRETATTAASKVKDTAYEHAPSKETVQEVATTVAITVKDTARTGYEHAPSAETVRETALTVANTVIDSARTVYEDAPSKERVQEVAHTVKESVAGYAHSAEAVRESHSFVAITVTESDSPDASTVTESRSPVVSTGTESRSPVASTRTEAHSPVANTVTESHSPVTSTESSSSTVVSSEQAEDVITPHPGAESRRGTLSTVTESVTNIVGPEPVERVREIARRMSQSAAPGAERLREMRNSVGESVPNMAGSEQVERIREMTRRLSQSAATTAAPGAERLREMRGSLAESMSQAVRRWSVGQESPVPPSAGQARQEGQEPPIQRKDSSLKTISDDDYRDLVDQKLDLLKEFIQDTSETDPTVTAKMQQEIKQLDIGSLSATAPTPEFHQFIEKLLDLAYQLQDPDDVQIARELIEDMAHPNLEAKTGSTRDPTAPLPVQVGQLLNDLAHLIDYDGDSQTVEGLQQILHHLFTLAHECPNADTNRNRVNDLQKGLLACQKDAERQQKVRDLSAQLAQTMTECADMQKTEQLLRTVRDLAAEADDPVVTGDMQDMIEECAVLHTYNYDTRDEFLARIQEATSDMDDPEILQQIQTEVDARFPNDPKQRILEKLDKMNRAVAGITSPEKIQQMLMTVQTARQYLQDRINQYVAGEATAEETAARDSQPLPQTPRTSLTVEGANELAQAQHDISDTAEEALRSPQRMSISDTHETVTTTSTSGTMRSNSTSDDTVTRLSTHRNSTSDSNEEMVNKVRSNSLSASTNESTSDAFEQSEDMAEQARSQSFSSTTGETAHRRSIANATVNRAEKVRRSLINQHVSFDQETIPIVAERTDDDDASALPAETQAQVQGHVNRFWNFMKSKQTADPETAAKMQQLMQGFADAKGKFSEQSEVCQSYLIQMRDLASQAKDSDMARKAYEFTQGVASTLQEGRVAEVSQAKMQFQIRRLKDLVNATVEDAEHHDQVQHLLHKLAEACRVDPTSETCQMLLSKIRQLTSMATDADQANEFTDELEQALREAQARARAIKKAALKAKIQERIDCLNKFVDRYNVFNMQTTFQIHKLLRQYSITSKVNPKSEKCQQILGELSKLANKARNSDGRERYLEMVENIAKATEDAAEPSVVVRSRLEEQIDLFEQLINDPMAFDAGIAAKMQELLAQFSEVSRKDPGCEQCTKLLDQLCGLSRQARGKDSVDSAQELADRLAHSIQLRVKVLQQIGMYRQFMYDNAFYFYAETMATTRILIKELNEAAKVDPTSSQCQDILAKLLDLSAASKDLDVSHKVHDQLLRISQLLTYVLLSENVQDQIGRLRHFIRSSPIQPELKDRILRFVAHVAKAGRLDVKSDAFRQLAWKLRDIVKGIKVSFQLSENACV
jgi:hypothetical protein